MHACIEIATRYEREHSTGSSPSRRKLQKIATLLIAGKNLEEFDSRSDNKNFGTALLADHVSKLGAIRQRHLDGEISSLEEKALIHREFWEVYDDDELALLATGALQLPDGVKGGVDGAAYALGWILNKDRSTVFRECERAAAGIGVSDADRAIGLKRVLAGFNFCPRSIEQAQQKLVERRRDFFQSIAHLVRRQDPMRRPVDANCSTIRLNLTIAEDPGAGPDEVSTPPMSAGTIEVKREPPCPACGKHACDTA